MEHAQHLSAADIPRFGQLGVIAAMQGIHCTSDAPYVLLRLGAKRAEEGAYVWQKLMKTGAIVGNGTDAPVEDVSPLACFYASVSRKLKDGTVFYPDQRMRARRRCDPTPWNNAYAAFEEETEGQPGAGQTGRHHGAFASDIMTVPEDEILATDVVYTIVGGKVRVRPDQRNQALKDAVFARLRRVAEPPAGAGYGLMAKLTPCRSKPSAS